MFIFKYLIVSLIYFGFTLKKVVFEQKRILLHTKKKYAPLFLMVYRFWGCMEEDRKKNYLFC
ncbi:hypothetical protein VC82_2660 [Flagellimonas lutaonensis]|uniref:Uncharacterized protein n=1 Tax=Flagellimonas lutaonensis TaxID=516051 RepID=A0A0D5YWC2_9FLAO|nr:hypothetical protein VC82_2660 [Allomuricauda lutaonensis]